MHKNKNFRFGLWEVAVNALQFGSPNLSEWIDHLLWACAIGGGLLWVWSFAHDKYLSSPQASQIVLFGTPQSQPPYKKYLFEIVSGLIVILTILGWVYWDFWRDRTDAQVNELRLNMHILQGVQSMDGYIRVTVNGTYPLAKYSSDYGLMAVCRGITRGKPFWNDPLLFRSNEYPIVDGDIEVPANEVIARHICSTPDHLIECIAALVSKKTQKLLPFNPGLRTGAGCVQRVVNVTR